MAFRDGVLLFSQPGALPAASLEQLITSIREVDMVEVHKQIAEQEKSSEDLSKLNLDRSPEFDETPKLI
jgi:thioredoxin 1